MSAQPQLLQIALSQADVVYTPDWVARDMVEFFKPTGRILEPASGDGAILKYLPGADWCEIEKGRDFFACITHYDWIITNPPYSCFGKWIYRGMEQADNVVYLAPCSKPFYSEKLFRKMQIWGSIKTIRVYGSGNKLDFPIGFLIGAIHFKKDYHGAMNISYFDAKNINK